MPIPRFLVDELAVHVAGKDPAGLVFTGERGGVLRAQVFQRAAFTAAADTLGVLFLAYTGVRWGEMAALCVGRLDLMRRRGRTTSTRSQHALRGAGLGGMTGFGRALRCPVELLGGPPKRAAVGYGVIGSPTDSGSVSLGSSPGTPAPHNQRLGPVV